MLFFWFTGASRDGDVSGKSDKLISKSEMKTRKAMLKLGMDPITGVSRVTLRNKKNASLFLLLECTVYFQFCHLNLILCLFLRSGFNRRLKARCVQVSNNRNIYLLWSGND